MAALLGGGGGWGAEAKLRSFIGFAIAKLDANTEELHDGTPEEDEAELVVFCKGLSRNLKATGASASNELKGTIATTLDIAFNIRNDTPGPELSVENLRAALVQILENALAPPEPLIQHAVDEEVKPSNLGDMSFQDAVTHMWTTLDAPQRVNWGDSGFTLNLQNKGRYDHRDTCDAPLFDWVNLEHPFWSSSVTTAFISLLDNYERETGEAEVVTRKEKQEVAAFLDAFCHTKVARFAYEFLKVHGHDRRCRELNSMLDFQNLISDIWFAPYRRFRANDSSGFEHVFVGEESRGKITGLHNWVQYYLEEKAGRIDYLGWKGKQDHDYDDDVNLVTVAFTWEDEEDAAVEEKPMSTILCGSTVECEMSLLTIAFLAGESDGETNLTLGTEHC